jgi:hypothetical protein
LYLVSVATRYQVYAGEAGSQHDQIYFEARNGAPPTFQIQGEKSSAQKAVRATKNVKTCKELIARN